MNSRKVHTDFNFCKVNALKKEKSSLFMWSLACIKFTHDFHFIQTSTVEARKKQWNISVILKSAFNMLGKNIYSFSIFHYVKSSFLFSTLQTSTRWVQALEDHYVNERWDFDIKKDNSLPRSLTFHLHSMLLYTQSDTMWNALEKLRVRGSCWLYHRHHHHRVV